MAETYIGEIRMFAGSFAPEGWAFCNGQTMLISDYETLFTLIGTTYGGDGQTTFALPELRARVPVHQGQLSGGGSYVPGARGGVENVTLTTPELPGHPHTVQASPNPGTTPGPGGSLLAGGVPMYAANAPDVSLAPASVRPTGGSGPHTNLQPYQCVAFIISLGGVYPPQG